MERDPEARWVMARLEAIAPAWTPDAARARALVRAERPVRRRVAPYGVAAVAVTLAAAFMLVEPVRTAAQALWYRMIVSRIDVVRLDFTAVPLDTHIRTDGAHVGVPTLEEAARRAGFVPRLPSPDVVSGETPALSVTSRFELTQTLRTGDLRTALARVGATDLEVPETWNGARLEATIGPLVIADYPNDVSIVQSAPIQLRVPTGLSLARVAEVVFRIAGSSWWEARILGEAYAASPAWLLDVPDDASAFVETLPMPGGAPGIAIDEHGDDGAFRSTVVVSRPSGLFAVSSASREISARIAEDISR
jgi:hypothetical protein